MDPKTIIVLLYISLAINVILLISLLISERKNRKKIRIFYCPVCHNLSDKQGDCRLHGYPVELNRGSIQYIGRYLKKQHEYFAMHGFESD